MRGKYLAKLDGFGEFGEYVSRSDIWPRYYFDKECMVNEVSRWIEENKANEDKKIIEYDVISYSRGKEEVKITGDLNTNRAFLSLLGV